MAELTKEKIARIIEVTWARPDYRPPSSTDWTVEERERILSAIMSKETQPVSLQTMQAWGTIGRR